MINIQEFSKVIRSAVIKIKRKYGGQVETTQPHFLLVSLSYLLITGITAITAHHRRYPPLSAASSSSMSSPPSSQPQPEQLLDLDITHSSPQNASAMDPPAATLPLDSQHPIASFSADETLSTHSTSENSTSSLPRLRNNRRAQAVSRRHLLVILIIHCLLKPSHHLFL